MPLTLSIGHSRKIGEANYGSRGASVSLELELEGNLVNEPQRLRESIRKLFDLARAAVEEELHGMPEANGKQPDCCNGHGQSRATPSQLRAIQTLARRHQIDLDSFLDDRFGDVRLEQLLLSQASALIEDLNSAPQGTGGAS